MKAFTCLFLLFAGALFDLAFGIKFELSMNPKHYGQRCIGVSAASNSFISGFVKILTSDLPNPVTAYVVDESNTRVWSKIFDKEVRFSFRSSQEPQYYQLCVMPPIKTGPSSVGENDVVLIEMSIELGHDLFDVNRALDLKVKPVEAEIISLQSTIAHISKEFESLFQSEFTLRNINESTNNRLSLFFGFSLFSLVGLIVWQILYLKRFFKSKKLID